MATLHEITNGAKGSDRVSLMEQKNQLDWMRKRAMNRVRSMIASAPNVFSKADERVYEDEVFSDRALELSGFMEHEDKIRAIQENIEHYIPALESDGRQLEASFRGNIEKALREKWIGRRSLSRWMQRLGGDNAYYWQKKEFIKSHEKFGKFMENWEKTAKARKEALTDPLIGKLTAKDVKNLSVFLDEDKFLDRPWEEREGLVAAVKGALAAKKKQMPALHAKAKMMLEGAAKNRDLSWNKVGVWMQRIFTSNANAELIEKFINGDGATIDGKKLTLTRLIANWSEASTHFRAIENKCKKFGVPRGFHFVNMEVFLNWDYDRRKTYVNEAEHRFTDIRDEPHTFLKIRHALDCKDWEEAQELLDGVESEMKSGKLLMSEQARHKVQSMKNYLRAHRKNGPEQKPMSENPEEILNQINDALSQIDQPWIRDRFIRAMARGYQTLWALSTMNFNWKWCRDRGYSSDEIDEQLRETAKEETFEHIKHGQPKGRVNNDMTSNTSLKTAPRWSTDTNSAQAIHTDHTTSNELLVDEYVHKNANNRSIWYWTRIMEKNVPYRDMEHVISTIQPILKRGVRKLQGMGIHLAAGTGGVRFAESAKLPSSLQKSQSKNGASAQYASKA